MWVVLIFVQVQAWSSFAVVVAVRIGNCFSPKVKHTINDLDRYFFYTNNIVWMVLIIEESYSVLHPQLMRYIYISWLHFLISIMIAVDLYNLLEFLCSPWIYDSTRLMHSTVYWFWSDTKYEIGHCEPPLCNIYFDQNIELGYSFHSQVLCYPAPNASKIHLHQSQSSKGYLYYMGYINSACCPHPLWPGE